MCLIGNLMLMKDAQKVLELNNNIFNINKKLYIKNVKLKLSMTDLKFVYTNSNKNIKIK